MPVRVVDSEEQFAELTNVSKVSVVKFGAPWCGACKVHEHTHAHTTTTTTTPSPTLTGALPEVRGRQRLLRRRAIPGR